MYGLVLVNVYIDCDLLWFLYFKFYRLLYLPSMKVVCVHMIKKKLVLEEIRTERQIKMKWNATEKRLPVIRMKNNK